MGCAGLNTGVQDAHNLAWELAAVLKEHASEALLSTYEVERQPLIWAPQGCATDVFSIWSYFSASPILPNSLLDYPLTLAGCLSRADNVQVAKANTALSVAKFSAALAVPAALGLDPSPARSHVLFLFDFSDMNLSPNPFWHCHQSFVPTSGSALYNQTLVYTNFLSSSPGHWRDAADLTRVGIAVWGAESFTGLLKAELACCCLKSYRVLYLRVYLQLDALKCHRLSSVVSTPLLPLGFQKCKEFWGKVTDSQPAAPTSSRRSWLQVSTNSTGSLQWLSQFQKYSLIVPDQFLYSSVTLVGSIIF
jgi:hypothetical protein